MKTQLGPFFRNRIQWRDVWILVVLICLPGSLYGQTKNQPVVADAIQKQAIQAVIDEINAIRKQLGGGIEEQLQGLHFGNPLKDQLKNDFDQELKRRLADPQAARLESGADSQREKWAVPPHSVFLARRTSIEHAPASPVRPLRSAARRIDEIAAELEEVGLFAEADSAREQALNFWLKARQLENRGQAANHPGNR